MPVGVDDKELPNMQTRKQWFLCSITCLAIAGCGDIAATSSSVNDSASSTSEALRPDYEASAVRATSQVEFNAMEIARLALHRSHDPAVLDFARKMLDAHTRSRTWLRRVASAHGFKVATTMDTQGQSMWSALFVKSGKPFDRALAEALGGLQQSGLKNISQLEKLDIHEETAVWCSAAADVWRHEQTSRRTLWAP